MGILHKLLGKKQFADEEERVIVHHGKKIYLGADHAGFELKEQLKKWLGHHQIEYEDLGNKILDPNDDYPDFAALVAKKVVREGTYGILVCGSAQGMCIASNKFKGVRAVVPFSLKEARLAREHNDANIICISGWFHTHHYSTKLLRRFLETPFPKEERHVRRLNKIRKLEQ
ncbi:RpiB/LacA/LacB family sugar-phosphate isomerase [Candidatus Woesearchaeota archaeon]|nr:RpiB/LacA/LacB family sugar-phosphate isomerase [Candidatus Woesearchaeota archaeon]